MHVLSRLRMTLVAALVTVFSWSVVLAAPPAGYSDYATYAADVAKLSGVGNVVRVSSLVKTLGGREVYLLTIGTGDVDRKPAVLVVGSVHAPHLAGSELTLRLAKKIAETADSDAGVKTLLERVTLYVIPRPNPDGFEANLGDPGRIRNGNARKTDDDRDGAVGEGPPDDLNGDGEVNEDGDGSYDPNRDWGWNWQPSYVQFGAHRYPMSILENRMAADFIMAHTNIIGGQSYHNTGGMILRGPGSNTTPLNPRDIAVYTTIAAKGERMQASSAVKSNKSSSTSTFCSVKRFLPGKRSTTRRMVPQRGYFSSFC